MQSVFLSCIEGLQLLKDLLGPQMPSSCGCNHCQSFVAAEQVDVVCAQGRDVKLDKKQ